MARVFTKLMKSFCIVVGLVLIAITIAAVAIGDPQRLTQLRSMSEITLPEFPAEVEIAEIREKIGALEAFLKSISLATPALPELPQIGGPEKKSNEGSIRVYFAPCSPTQPDDMDDAFLGLLDSARGAILGAFFELELPSVADKLIEKHDQGIDVRLVVDSQYEEEAALQRCIAAGIPVEFDNRSAYMHNKFCVVDSRQVWTGSTNITENGMYRNNNNAIWLESAQIAQNYMAEFDEMFNAGLFGPRSPAATPYPVCMVQNIEIENYFAPEDGVERQILSEIAVARHRVIFMAFSFTSEPIANALVDRMKAGVAVQGLFEDRNAGSRYSKDDFLKQHGATVYMDTNPYTMHHKVFVLDGSTVITGSYNFSNAADESNDENVLIIHNAEVAQYYTEEFEMLTRSN